MNYQIITHNQIIGFHRWPGAPEKYAYLSDWHRHVFVIRCWFDVSHSDREIEINDMQDRIERDVKNVYGTANGVIDFQGMSCEDIANWCIGVFGCVECEVLEDGFGGAHVRK